MPASVLRLWPAYARIGRRWVSPEVVRILNAAQQAALFGGVTAWNRVAAAALTRADLRDYFRNMSLANRYGDLEISDPQALRALAHPTRLAILERLQRYGPSTASRLSPHVGATPSVVSWHLRHLASFGLVKDWAGAGTRRERGWQAVARGYRFVPREGDSEAIEAARQLDMERMVRAAEIPMRWLEQDEVKLPPDWRAESGLASTRVKLTLEELKAIEDAIEQVIAPYVNRAEAQAPDTARGVRFLRYVLPESSSAQEQDA